VNPNDYWRECLASSFEEHGISATADQIKMAAEDVQGAHENYGMAFHAPSENPLCDELSKAKAELRAEKEKVCCRVCHGKGSITVPFGVGRVSISSCYSCNGEGKHTRE
jgi:DnaJ-class molecular chaperone